MAYAERNHRIFLEMKKTSLINIGKQAKAVRGTNNRGFFDGTQIYLRLGLIFESEASA
jgi:hypothetical protein